MLKQVSNHAIHPSDIAPLMLLPFIIINALNLIGQIYSKRRRRTYKDQAFVAVSGFSRLSSQRRNKRMLGFVVLLKVPTKLVRPSNPGPSLVII